VVKSIAEIKNIKEGFCIVVNSGGLDSQYIIFVFTFWVEEDSGGLQGKMEDKKWI